MTRPTDEYRRRVVIENVRPQVDSGTRPAKGTVGRLVHVEADVFADGHESLSCLLLHRRDGEKKWRETPMRLLWNDHWLAEFPVEDMTSHYFTVEGWVDPFKTWQQDLEKRIAAGQNIAVDLKIGAALIEDAATRATEADRKKLTEAAAKLAGNTSSQKQIAKTATSAALTKLISKYPDRSRSTRYGKELEVRPDVPRAGFGAWYEMFPRSTSDDPERHGTFKDCEKRLPYVAGMGFDVLYLPPIHPIGKTHRKGRNNATTCEPGDPGSPWAIGSEEGGHKAINPLLGTLEDFRSLVTRAREMGIDVALDIAFQCSPDHPYVKEHPDWFRMRPDGTVQYAENPPKKYEDIYPFDFETRDWRALWDELKSVFEYWIDQGVRVFRVDNPHTKPFRFWEWLIAGLKDKHPDVILLAEAFTRPRIMEQLAKLGFTQSYTYFAWRNSKRELTDYFTELTQTPVRDFMRPNVWPNTPDILTEYLQNGGRPAFITRLVLAATLSANYGIYGPAFELCVNVPREPGSEEYRNSEKYEVKYWRLDAKESVRPLITLLNEARRENPALQSNESLAFHQVDNDQLICYSKRTLDNQNIVLAVVNLDYAYRQSGWVELPIADWGIADDEEFQLHDLLGGARYKWRGRRNYAELDPKVLAAHVFRVRRRADGWKFE